MYHEDCTFAWHVLRSPPPCGSRQQVQLVRVLSASPATQVRQAGITVNSLANGTSKATSGTVQCIMCAGGRTVPANANKTVGGVQEGVIAWGTHISPCVLRMRLRMRDPMLPCCMSVHHAAQ